ncbi:hypothetical protein GOP47_0011343 [Adiantum capillus-veneris]|uniref:DUF3598 domain-containing protein n=1 Tax=Adiantum capillus-veneris TaxID=13818 RepID=A0A9D4ZHJ3_ADICA|nr:hypothetical protein GOP47_0011343 [Adiantum capillus-veneris]
MTPTSLRLHTAPLFTSVFSPSSSSATCSRHRQRYLLPCHASGERDVSIDVLQDFIKLNVGCWTGSFTQYDALGNTLQCIPTRLAANSYGRGDQVSLYQTLSIKQAPSKTFIAGEDVEENEWAEFKLDETNLLTIDKQQQVGYFPKDRAYTVTHRTTEMLDKVIRAGVLGEDGEDLDDAPPGVKLPSRRPALVCESCLYTEEGDGRVRGFHVLDPRGLLDFIGVFHEKRDNGPFIQSADNSTIPDLPQARLTALLGCWSGHSITRRTGVYGSTLAEDDIRVTYDLRDDGSLIQDIKTSKGNLHLTGAAHGSLLQFEKGLQTTLLPGGLALTAPVNVGQSVGRSQAFYFEFSWVYSPGKRRRLVRTYDTDGLVVSSTFVEEVKL